jgi:two-component system NtrC family sensor kinase
VLTAIALMPLSGTVFLHRITGSRDSPWRITAASLAMDTLLASWVIRWTGGAVSPCLPFYLTPVMAAAFRFGLRGTLFFTLFAIAGYSVAGVCSPAADPIPDGMAARVLRITILFAAAGVGIGALHRKLERYRKEKRLRRQLEKTNRDLECALREKEEAREQLLHAEKLSSLGRLVAGVAHEINNPISFVYGNLVHLETYVRRLKELLCFDENLPLGPEETKRREALKQSMEYDYLWGDMETALSDSRNGAERVRRIVAALSKFSRLRKGTFRQVDVREVLENALYILAGKQSKDNRVVRDYGTSVPVRGDPDELNQLFLNLLSNAVDALDGSWGIIRVKTFTNGTVPEPQEVIVEVEDDGPGIPPENRDRVFEPFFTTKEVGRGTGLGLSIAYGIVRRHRGKITLSSPPGGGTRFRVALPRWDTA